MNQSIYNLQNNISVLYNFSIVVKYALNRRVTQTVSDDTSFNYPSDNSPLPLNQLLSIYNTINYCNTSTYLPGFYISLIRLYTVGNAYKPRPIIYTNTSGVNPYL